MIEIHPNTFYRPEDIEQMLGRRCLEHLRINGLRTLGGWYIGEKVLETYLRAVAQKARQRVPSKKGGSYETGYGEKMEACVVPARPVQLISKRERSTDLGMQLEELKRRTRRAGVSAKAISGGEF